MKYYIEFWKRAFDFKGVASRPQYWFAVLANIIVSFVLSFILILIDQEGTISMIVYGLYGLAMIIPNISITVRRLHDHNMSGLLYLIVFIPFGSIVLLVFTCLATIKEGNRWRMFDIQRGYINGEMFEEPLAQENKWVYQDYDEK